MLELANPKVLEVENLWKNKGNQTSDEFRQNAFNQGYTEGEIESVVQSFDDTPSNFKYPQQKRDLTELKNIISTIAADEKADMDDIAQYILDTTEYGFDDIDNALSEIQSGSKSQESQVNPLQQAQQSQAQLQTNAGQFSDSVSQAGSASIDELANQYLDNEDYSQKELPKPEEVKPTGFRLMDDEEYKQMSDAYIDLGEDELKKRLVQSGMYSKEDVDSLLKNFKMSNYIRTKSVLDPRMLKPNWFVTGEFNLSPEDQQVFEKMYADAPAKRLGLDLFELMSGASQSVNSLVKGVSKVLAEMTGVADTEVAKSISDAYDKYISSDKDRRRHLVQTGINKFDISDISPTDLYLPAKGASTLAKVAKTLAVQGGGAYAHARGQGKSEEEAGVIGAISGVTPLALDGVISAVSRVSRGLGTIFVTDKQLAGDIISNYNGDAKKFVEDFETLKELGIKPTIPEFVTKDSASALATRLARMFSFLKRSENDSITTQSEAYLSNSKALNQAVDSVLANFSQKDVNLMGQGGVDLAAQDFANVVTKYHDILKKSEDEAYKNFRKEASQFEIPLESLDKLKNIADKLNDMDALTTITLGTEQGKYGVSDIVTNTIESFKDKLKGGKVTGEFVIAFENFLNELGRGELSGGGKQLMSVLRGITDNISSKMLKSAPESLQEAYRVAESIAKRSSTELRELFKDESNVRNLAVFKNLNQVESTALFDKLYKNQTDLKVTKLSEIMKMYNTLPKESTQNFTKQDFLKKFLSNHLQRNLAINSFEDVLKLDQFAKSVETLLHWKDKSFLKAAGIETDANLNLAVNKLITLGKYASKLNSVAKSLPTESRMELTTMFYRMIDVLRAVVAKRQVASPERLQDLVTKLKKSEYDLNKTISAVTAKKLGVGVRQASKFAEQPISDE